jgi:catechol 2,3-dioxygenase-like lactoylglutathione lyase family enzyme
MSVLLVVSNVDRSVEFYRDMLGFTVEGQTSGGAVLSHGGGRIVLQRLTDMAPVDRRLIVVQISVPDVDAAYRRLKAQGVEFAQRPGWIRVGERLDLRTAKLHDPDGHAIQLVEGWQRGSGTR